MTASLRELIDEVKVRHVRSASGARRYGLPIGSPIVDAPSTPPVGKPKLSAMMGKPSRTATPAASSTSGIPPKPVIPRMASRAAREKAEKEYTAWMKKYGPSAEVNAPAKKPGGSGVDPKAPAHIKELAAKFHTMTFENTDSGELVKVTDLQDGDIAFGRCSDADSAFAIFADRESKLNTGYLEMNSPDGGMHYATVIEEPGGQQWVVDFTYRQFDPASKWPLVVTMADYKQKYASGGEDVEVSFDGSLRMDNLKTLSELVVETKLRHVRSTSGVRRFHLPIGSPIVAREGAPKPSRRHRKRVLRDLAGKPTPAGGKKPQTLRDVAAKPAQELHGGGNPQGIHGRELMKNVLQLDHDDNDVVYSTASHNTFMIQKPDGRLFRQSVWSGQVTDQMEWSRHDGYSVDTDPSFRKVATFKKGELTLHDATRVAKPKLDFDRKKYTADQERLDILDEYTNYLKGGHEVWGSDDPDYDNDRLRIDDLIDDLESDANGSMMELWQKIAAAPAPSNDRYKQLAQAEVDKRPAKLAFLQHLKDIRDGNADLNDEGLPEGWEGHTTPGRNFANLLDPIKKTDWKRDAGGSLMPGKRLTERKNFVLDIGQGTREDFEKILAKDKDYQGALAEAERLRAIPRDDKTAWQSQDQIRAEHYVNRMYRDRLKHYMHSLRPMGVDDATGAYLQAAPEDQHDARSDGFSRNQLLGKGDEGSYDNWLDLFDQAQDYYPRDWLRKANVRQYKWAYATSGGWHNGGLAKPSDVYAASDDFSDDPSRSFTIGMLLQSQYHETGYNGGFDKKSEDVAVHEIGHSMEMMIPGLTALEWAFLYDRAKDHTPSQRGGGDSYIAQRNYKQPMDKRSSIPRMENVAPGTRGTVGYSDNFGRAYTGRVYDQFDGRSANPDREKTIAGSSPLEIFTTGMQETFANPVFGDVKSRDNQLMDFTIGSLLSLNWVWPDSGEQEPDIARAERKARLAQGSNAPAVKPAKVTPPAPVVTPPPVEPAKPPVAAAPKRLLKPVPGTTKVKTRDGFREVSGDDYGHFLIHGKSGDWTATHKASGLSVGTSSSKREVIDKINALQDMTDPHIPDYWAKEKPTDNPNNKIGQLELTDEQKRNGGSAAGGIFINRDVNQIATRLTMPGVDTERFNQAKVHYKAVTGKEWTKPQPASKARTGTTPTPTPPTPPAPSTSGSWSPEKLPALHSSFTFDGRTYVVTNSKPLQKYDAPWDQRGQGFVYAQPVGEAGATSRKFTPEELNFGGDFAPAKYVDTPNGVKGVRVQGNDWEQTWTDGNTGQKLGSYYYNRKGARDQRYEVRNEVGSNIQKVSSAQAAREALVKHANLVAAQRGK